MDYKDVLLPGASRVAAPYSGGAYLPGYTGDAYDPGEQRNDWVQTQWGPEISGSSGPPSGPASYDPNAPSWTPPATTPWGQPGSNVQFPTLPQNGLPGLDPYGTGMAGGAATATEPALQSPAQMIAALVAQLGSAAPKINVGNAAAQISNNTSYLATLKKILAQLGGNQYGGVQ